MNDRIEDASSRVSDNVGSNGNSGNNGLIYRTGAFREAEERRAATAADLHRWLAEDRMGQTVSVREVQQRGPLSIRRLGAKRIRETLRRLQSQGMVKAGPVATGTSVPASTECWIVEADDNIVDSLLLFDLGNDALIAISETLGDERDLIGKVLASALWQWAHPDAGQPQETSRRTAHVLAAVQSGVA